MKIKTNPLLNSKHKILSSIIFLVFCMLLNASSKNDNFLSLKNFFELDATIAVDRDNVCIDDTVTLSFEAIEGKAPFRFTYTIDGQTQVRVKSGDNSNTATFDIKLEELGSFDIELVKVEDGEGIIKDDITGQEITITVNSPPTIDFTFNNDICANEDIQFTSTESGNGGFTYEWDFGDGQTSTRKDPTHQFKTALGCGTTNFDVILTVTDDNGCATSKTKTITVKEKPNIVIFDLNDRDFSNCDRTTPDPNYQITVGLDGATSSCASNFVIIWGDGTQENATRNSFPIVHNYTEFGVYDLIVRSNSSNGCANEIKKEVKNISNPSGSLVNPGSTQNICTPTNSIEFSISKWGINSLDTEYFVNYGDGNTLTLTQQELINSNLNLYNAADPESSPNFPVPHIYEKSSCPNTFTASLNVSNACSSTESILPGIRVIDKPKLDFDIPDVVCINTSVTFQNKSIYGSGSNCSESGRFTWDFGDGTQTSSSTQISSPTHSYNTPGKYIVTLSATSFCGPIEITKEVCVEPEITPSFSVDNDDGCIPFNLTTTNTTDQSNLCSAPTYKWEVTYASDNCGSSSDWEFTNGTDETSENPQFNFKNPGKYSLIQNIITGCGTVTNTKIIDVKKPPTVAINAIDDTCGITTINPLANVENCTSNTGGISYSWTFTGGNPTTSNTLNPGDIVYNNPGIYEVILEVTSECGVSNRAVQSFEVFEQPVITNTITTQEICSGQNTAEIVLNTDNPTTTFTWSAVATANISGFTQNGNSNAIPSQRILNNGGSIGTVTYTVTPTIGTCEGDSVDFVITVNPSPVITTQPRSSEICLNGSATRLEVAYENGVGTPSYQWFSNTTNINTGGTAIAGATSENYDPPTDTVGEVFYYVEISFTSGGCSEIISNTASVKVTPQITVDAIAAPQTICVGGNANELSVSFSGGTGNASYQWYSNTSNTNSGGTQINGATNNNYTPPTFTSVGTFYYYAEISLDGNGCSSATSDAFTINVLTDPVIDSQPIVAQELCQSAVAAELSVVVSGGTASAKIYQWYVNTTNSNSGGVALTGENAAVYRPATTNVGTFYYYVVVSQSESGCSVTSEVSTLKVNEAPTFTTQPSSSEVCLNGSATRLEVAYENGTGTPSYQWFSNTTNINTGGTAIAGATTENYDPPTNTVGEIFYYVEISFTSGGCSEIISNTASVKVAPQITVDGIAAPQTICVGGDADELSVSFSGGTGNASYQWYSNTSNTNTGGTQINGATNNNYTPPTFTSAGTFYYYAEISLDGNGCSSATSDAFTINVLTDPVIDSQPIVAQELCQSAVAAELSVVVSGGTASAKIYQWYVNTTNSNSGGVALTGENAAVYRPATTNVGTFYYYVVVSQSESGCSVTSEVSTLKVNEAPTFTTQPSSSEVCLNGSATRLEVAYENGTGTPSYQWFSNTTNINTGGTAIAGATTENYDPPTDTVGEIFYYVEISFTSGGCSKISSDIASVIVNQIPVVSNAEITIYSEDTFTFDPSIITGNTVPNGTQYTWGDPTFTPAGSIIGSSAATVPQNIISQTLENTGTTAVEVTYVITPATSKCSGDSFTLVVTVNPNITSNAIVTNISCFEANDGEISTRIEGGIPFTNGAPYQVSWSGPNGFTSSDANITNLEAGIYILTITDNTGFSITEEWNVTQPDVLTISKDLEKNISCFQGNDGTVEVTISGGTTPYQFNWSSANGSGIVPNVKNQNALTAGTYRLEVVDKNNCTVVTEFVLTEPDGLKIETTFTQDILCFGDATGAIEINVSGGTKVETSPGVFDYLYNWSGPNGYTSTSKNIDNLLVGTYTVAVTDNQGCTTTTDVVINQSSEININYTKVDVTCYGEADGAIDVIVTGGVEPYQISWSNLANGFSQSNLTADTYTATITDGNNCVKQVDIVIEQPIFFIDPDVKPISCNGENDGSIDLNLTGGVAPFTVTWSDDASAGVQRNNLAAGTYTVTIVDSDVDQCPITETFTFTNPPAMAVNTTVLDAIDCDIVSSGSIDLEVSGGSAPYTFLWNTNATTEDLENIPQGDYAVIITDKNGCTIEREFNIFRQEPLSISFDETTIIDCDLKTVQKQTRASVTGGYLPYTYTWSAGNVSDADDSVMTTDQEGSYSLTITDDKGCQETKSFLVDVPTIGNADFRYSAFALTTYDLLSIEDVIQFTNLSTGDFANVKWDFGDGSPTTNEENPLHTYDEVGNFNITLTVEFTAGCTEVFTRTVAITKGYSLVNPTAFTPNGDGFNETIRPSHRGFTTINMTIYDTWGTRVYFEESLDFKGWDGTIGNKLAENGNYVMVVKGTTFYNKEIIISSPVTLLK